MVAQLTDEDSSDSEWQTLLVDVTLVLVVQHPVESRDVSVLITNDGEIELGSGRSEVVDVFDPFAVGFDVVG
jgi:hypothetical protein